MSRIEAPHNSDSLLLVSNYDSHENGLCHSESSYINKGCEVMYGDDVTPPKGTRNERSRS